MFEGRSIEAKKALIRGIYSNINQQAGITPQDIEITIFETPKENWGIRGLPGDELALGYTVEVWAFWKAAEIPVAGHTGLTPQTDKSFKKVGATAIEAEKISEGALKIQAAGAVMLILEHMPYFLAGSIAKDLTMPTIGIGAGPDCDGQVLAINDALGIGDYWPPFSKQYAQMSKAIRQAAMQFSSRVGAKEFPDKIIQFAADENN